MTKSSTHPASPFGPVPARTAMRIKTRLPQTTTADLAAFGPQPALIGEPEPSDLSEPSRRELVAEAALTFGEEAARELATHLGVTFADCRADIEALR